MIQDLVFKMLEEKREKFLSLSTWLYENPEIAMEEVESAKKIAQFLREQNFEVEEQLGGMETAFRGTIKNGEGPRLAFVAEYDALPGNGHACGHHMIAGMSVAAAVCLAEVLKELPGEISVIGTPAEEIGEGKPYLIDKGIFDGYDAVLMLHPYNSTNIYPDIIAIGGIDFSFIGKPAHAGAEPHMGVNALDAVVLFYNNVNALRQQLKDRTRIHGIILEAGSAANIIPAFGKVRLEFRAPEQDYFDLVVEKVIACARGAALATGCELSYAHFEPTCSGMKHNKILGELFRKHLEDLGCVEDDAVFSGSSDIGNVSQIIPTLHPFFKITEGGEGIHTQEFLQATRKPYAQEQMMLGAKLLAMTGLSLLTDTNLLKAAREEMQV